jgi:hypothetical protein
LHSFASTKSREGALQGRRSHYGLLLVSVVDKRDGLMPSRLSRVSHAYRRGRAITAAANAIYSGDHARSLLHTDQSKGAPLPTDFVASPRN